MSGPPNDSDLTLNHSNIVFTAMVGIVRQVNAIWNTDKNMIQTLHQIRYGIIYEYWQIPLKFSNCCKYELTSFDGPFCCSTGIFRYQAKMIMSDFDCCKRNNIVITKSRVKPQPNTSRDEKNGYLSHLISFPFSVLIGENKKSLPTVLNLQKTYLKSMKIIRWWALWDSDNKRRESHI